MALICTFRYATLPVLYEQALPITLQLVVTSD
jgi:hypothetical protein